MAIITNGGGPGILCADACEAEGLMVPPLPDDLVAELRQFLSPQAALRNPTISQLSDAGWLAINTIVEEKTVRELIPKLKAARAEGIVEYPLNKVVY